VGDHWTPFIAAVESGAVNRRGIRGRLGGAVLRRRDGLGRRRGVRGCRSARKGEAESWTRSQRINNVLAAVGRIADQAPALRIVDEIHAYP